MAAGTEEKEKQSGADEQDERVKAARQFGAGDEGREMIAHAAQGAELDESEEEDALEHLLGARPAIRYEIEVAYGTAKGLRPLWFITRSIDTTRIDKIEERNLDEKTGRIDRLVADCEIVAEACTAIRSANGRVVALNSDEFLTLPQREGEPFKVADPAMALRRRFADQLGLVNGVCLEIKRTCGYSPERVKSAKRVLTAGALG